MAIKDTINLLQTLNRSITGIATNGAPALADYPTVLDTAALPLVITWPGVGHFYSKGGAAKQSVRIYRVLCFVEPVGVNDIPSRAVETADLMQRFIDAYISVANIPQATPPTYQTTLESGPDMQHTDNGMGVLTFSGKAYSGFELQITVREYWL